MSHGWARVLDLGPGPTVGAPEACVLEPSGDRIFDQAHGHLGEDSREEPPLTGQSMGAQVTPVTHRCERSFTL